MIETKTNGTLPAQLQNNNFGFVKLRAKSKIPIDKNWQNKRHPFEEIQSWIKQGFNYGVLGGCGHLIVIDCDEEVINKIVRDELPATFAVRTPGRGYHFYFICSDIKNKIVLEKDGVHYGEIISNGAQAVGAGSIHPDTGTPYMVDRDVEIVEVSSNEIFDSLSDYIPSANTVSDKLVKEFGNPYFLKGDKVSGINEGYWAALHNKENIQVYEPIEKTFYRYNSDNGLYQEISCDVIKQEISKRILEVSRSSNNLAVLERYRTNKNLNNIVSHLKGISEKRDSFGRNGKEIVHLANGVLRFRGNDADLVEFSPEFYSRNQSPIPFDEKAQCPRFLNELLYPATTPDDAVLIQKYAGLCLLGDNHIQRVLILDGEASRGKTTLSLIIQHLVGMNNVTQLRTQHLTERFELYRFLKRTLLVGVDVPGNFLSQKGAQVIKGLVGRDCMDAEQKGGTGSFQIQGNYCIIITTNSRLRVRFDGDLTAWKRRLLIVRFESPPPKKKIIKFADILIKDEGSGILNWALQGLRMVLDDMQINKCGDIYMTDDQNNVVDALLAESDSLRHFLSDNVLRDEDRDLSISEIEEVYAEYCCDMKWNPLPIIAVRKELEQLMLELFQTSKSHSIMRDGKSVRGFRKVRLKS